MKLLRYLSISLVSLTICTGFAYADVASDDTSLAPAMDAGRGPPPPSHNPPPAPRPQPPAPRPEPPAPRPQPPVNPNPPPPHNPGGPGHDPGGPGHDPHPGPIGHDPGHGHYPEAPRPPEHPEPHGPWGHIPVFHYPHYPVFGWYPAGPCTIYSNNNLNSLYTVTNAFGQNIGTTYDYSEAYQFAQNAENTGQCNFITSYTNPYTQPNFCQLVPVNGNSGLFEVQTENGEVISGVEDYDSALSASQSDARCYE